MTSRAVDPSISRMPLPTDAENLATVCVLCSHNCGLRVDVAGGRIVAVRADETSPISKGYICNKGFSIGHYVDHAQRVVLASEVPVAFKPSQLPWSVLLLEVFR